MKRISIVGLCLMAVGAFSAISSTSASAEVLFKFKSGTSIVKGTFESLGGLSVLESTAGEKIHCKDVHNKGLFHTSTLGIVLLLFLGCSTEVFGSTITCQNSGAGEIHLPGLGFHLGLAHSGTSTTIPAIIILLPSGGISFKCGSNTITVKGSAIGELQTTGGARLPLNTPEKEVNLVYKQTGGKQELTLILMPGGGTLTNQHLESTLLFTHEAGEQSTDTLKGFKTSGGVAEEIEVVEP